MKQNKHICFLVSLLLLVISPCLNQHKHNIMLTVELIDELLFQNIINIFKLCGRVTLKIKILLFQIQNKVYCKLK